MSLGGLPAVILSYNEVAEALSIVSFNLVFNNELDLRFSNSYYHDQRIWRFSEK